MRAFAGELAFNLHAIDHFMASRYAISGEQVTSNGQPCDSFDYVTCSTTTFESLAGKEAIQAAPEDVRNTLIRIYQYFRRINDNADSLKAAFRPWRVKHYLDAIEGFSRELRESAQQFVRDNRD
jgi:hypothetical protein